MQIKPHDSALSTAPTSIRPPGMAQLTLAGTHAAPVSVSLSGVARALSAVLAEALPQVDSAVLYDVLTPADRLVLANAVDLVRSEHGDPAELRGLVRSLYVYRASPEQARLLTDATSTPVRPSATRPREATLRAPPLNEPTAGSVLALATFSARDESLARTILASLALRDTALDHGFVRALLDPDRHAVHAVSFAFLRRLVVAFSPAHSEGSVDPGTSFARRSARSALAETVEALGLSRSDLPRPSRETADRGTLLLGQRASRFVDAQSAHSPNGERVRLSSNDRAVLGALYVAAERRGVDLRAVDHVARALIALREAERVELTGEPEPPPAAAPARERTSSSVSLRRSHAEPRASTLGSHAEPRASTLGSHAEPRASTLGSHAEPRASTRPLPDREHMELEQPQAARNYGSASQLAAKLAGSYRSLIPPPSLHAAAMSTELLEQGARPDAPPAPAAPALGAVPSSLQAPTLTRPLDLGLALGLSGWLGERRILARRTRPHAFSHKVDDSVHGVGPVPKSTPEAEADDPVLDGSQRHRRVRWQLLFQRRLKRARARNR